MSFEALAYVKQIDLGDASTSSNHLLLRSIAEHTFNDSGICRLSQKQLATEVHCTDRHLRRLLKDLDDLNIIIRHSHYDASTGHRCNDGIELVGFKAWIDSVRGGSTTARPEEVDTKESAEKPTKPAAGHIVRQDALPDNMSAGPTGHVRPALPDTDVRDIKELGTRKGTSLPPTPQGAREGESKFNPQFEKLIEGHQDPEAVRRLVDLFLRPATLRLQVQHAAPLALFEGCLEACLGASDHALRSAVDVISTTRKKIVSPRCFIDALAAAQQQARPGDLHHKPDQITITKADNPQEFAAWSKWAAANEAISKQAALIRKFIYQLGCKQITVPSLWPPTKAEMAQAIDGQE